MRFCLLLSARLVLQIGIFHSRAIADPYFYLIYVSLSMYPLKPSPLFIDNKKTIQGRQIIQPQLWFSWHLKTQNAGELSEPVMFQHGPTASKGSSGLYLVQPNPPTLSTADVQGKAPQETLREKEENLDDGAIKI